jgi:hypothetical protein
MDGRSEQRVSSPKRGAVNGGPTMRQKAMGAVLLTVLTSSGGILMQLSKEVRANRGAEIHQGCSPQRVCSEPTATLILILYQTRPGSL